MVEVNVVQLGGSGSSINVRVVAFNSTEGGIASITLLDRSGVPIAPGTVPVEGCPSSVAADFPAVAVGQLPVRVEVRECMTEAATRRGPFLDPTSDDPQIRPSCLPTVRFPPSPACSRARDEAAALRRMVAATCDELGRAEAVRNALFVAAVALAVLAIAAFAVAAFVAAIPGFQGVAALLVLVGRVLLALAAAAFAAAIAAGIAAEAIRARLGAERGRFLEAADRVRMACCPDDFTEEELRPPC